MKIGGSIGYESRSHTSSLVRPAASTGQPMRFLEALPQEDEIREIGEGEVALVRATSEPAATAGAKA